MTLAFIDTNMLVRLYEKDSNVRKKDVQPFIRRIDHVITTDQVRNEFHRRRIGTIKAQAKTLDDGIQLQLKVPTMLEDNARNLGLYAKRDEFMDSARSVRDLLEQLLDSPESDEILSLVDQMFSERETHLQEGTDAWRAIVDRGRIRQELGNPPGKQRGAFGDAINWEWCLDVCAQRRDDLIIISRDGDFGERGRDGHYLNWYLQQEFERHVGTGYEVHLTDSLTEGLQRLGGV